MRLSAGRQSLNNSVLTVKKQRLRPSSKLLDDRKTPTDMLRKNIVYRSDRQGSYLKSTSLNKTQVLQGLHSKSSPTNELPKLTCKAAYIVDLDNHSQLYSHNENEKREIASLTKIMTCYVVLQYIRSKELIPEEQYFKVSKLAASIKGSTAELEEGDEVSIWDLLYGLMLPSGNDAAVCLAENIGKHFDHGKKTPLDNFVEEMNAWAKKLEMKNTIYQNPHGLSIRHNLSTASDQMKLIKLALQDSIFVRLIDKKMYPCSITDKQGWTRELFWQNTNRLLYKGYSGIKTGFTAAAGFCLASWYRKANMNILIVVLGAFSDDHRFHETVHLTKWIINERVKTNKALLSDRDIANLLQQ